MLGVFWIMFTVQGLSCLEAYDLEIGLLLNFGAKKLEFKRLTNERKLKAQHLKATIMNIIASDLSAVQTI
jgi:hypothetical protein